MPEFLPAMFRRLLPLLLLLPACAAPPALKKVPQSEAEKQRLMDASFGQVPTVNSQEELNLHLQTAVDTMNPLIAFRLGPHLKNTDFRTLVERSSCGADIVAFSALMEKNSGEVRLELTYHDGARLSAARRHPHLRSQLSPAERKTLSTLEQRFDELHRAHPAPYDFLLAAHDDLIRRSTYRECKETEDGSVTVLTEKGIGVCAAYADTLRLLADMAGIPNRRIVGTAKGVPHVWNLVYTDGAWRHIDATWDDPVVPKGTPQRVEHTYFCCSDADMARAHRWNREGLPPVSKEPPLYLTRNGLYHRSYAELWKAAEAAADRGQHSYSGHMTDFGSNERLHKEAERYMATGGKLRIRSVSAPKDKSYGTVTLEFSPC